MRPMTLILLIMVVWLVYSNNRVDNTTPYTKYTITSNDGSPTITIIGKCDEVEDSVDRLTVSCKVNTREVESVTILKTSNVDIDKEVIEGDGYVFDIIYGGNGHYLTTIN